MLMMGGQVAGMRKHPYGRVDQLEDRYLGMVEAPSSNLGTSTRNDSKQFFWTVRHKEHQSQTNSLLARHVHHLNRFHPDPWWTCAMKNLFSIVLFIDSARPPPSMTTDQVRR